MRRVALVLALLSAAGARLPAQTDQGVGIVQSASRKYQALSTFQADFRQVTDDKYYDKLESKGTLYLEGKNRFAMRWTDPANEFIVLDGTSTWMYLPSTSPGHVKKYPQQNHPTYGTNLLGIFLDNAVDRYNITYVSTEMIDGHLTDAVLMEPKANDLQFRRATVWFDRALGMPRRLSIEETRDHKKTLYLSSLQMNHTIPPAMFVCDISKLPKGTRIIEQ